MTSKFGNCDIRQVLTAAPRAASRQANLLGGLVKVANESAPSISSVSGSTKQERLGTEYRFSVPWS